MMRHDREEIEDDGKASVTLGRTQTAHVAARVSAWFSRAVCDHGLTSAATCPRVTEALRTMDEHDDEHEQEARVED